MPKVIIWRDGAIETEFDPGHRDWRIGRSETNDITLLDPRKSVSRFHAQLREENGRWIFIDLNSQNGSWKDGQRVSRLVLEHADEVLFGDYKLAFQDVKVAAPPPPPASPADVQVATADVPIAPDQTLLMPAKAQPSASATPAGAPPPVLPRSSGRNSPIRAGVNAKPIRRVWSKVHEMIASPPWAAGRTVTPDRPAPAVAKPVDELLLRQHAPAADDNETQPSPRSRVSDDESRRREVPGGRIDRVHLSLVAPPDVRPGEPFVLAVWAHFESQRELVLQRALEASGGLVSIHTKGPTRVAHGTILTVRVQLTDAVIEPREDTILWEGEMGAAHFSARVPDGARERSHDGTAVVFAGGVQIARIAFTIRATSQPSPRSLLGRTVPHRTAFASYAREDLSDVGARIQGMQKVIPDLDIFWDVLSLRSGQRWERELSNLVPSRDVFFLFWSEAASRSSWVEREWRCALEARGLDYINPIPLVSPDVVPPPPELAPLHFGDRLLPFTARRSVPIVYTTYRILKSSMTRIFRLWSGSSNAD